MSVTFKTDDNELICTFHSNILASSIPSMREKLNVSLDNELDWEILILDINKVEKIDSLGINLIVWLFRMAEAAEKDFKIINCSSELMKLFKLFRLQEQFTIEESEAGDNR